ncbi:hypothetical protein HK414_25165 [Ramlibacter terrae]|uniref:Uncharacterized protein n=1 Tax=Ramlibacter terrae TaxID=2732511 RepID=A0ABX6P5T6_9BURK|nr:hypothetical protein HK414_25165 [Ramlibacter terrae]
MHKAIWQADGNLVIRGNTRALLFRALDDARAELGKHGDATDPQVVRTLQALQTCSAPTTAACPARSTCSATRHGSRWRATSSRADRRIMRFVTAGGVDALAPAVGLRQIL